MYKVGDIFYNDEEYSARAEFCNKNGYAIVEIEADTKGRRFQIQQPQISETEKLRNELYDLEDWFTMYDNQIKQYQRCSRLNLSYDNKYGTIEELDEQAASKAARISEIRKLLSDT